MVEAPNEVVVTKGEEHDELKTRVRELFDTKGYMRIRIRKRGKKKSKVRNLRAITSNPVFAKEVVVWLKHNSVNPTSYLIGKSTCIDIEGNHKLETFVKAVSPGEKLKKQIEEAIKPLSISMNHSQP